MWVVYAFISSLLIIGLEYVYRVGTFGGFVEALPYIIIPILGIQGALFYMFKTAPSYMLGWAVFAVLNTLMRLYVNNYLGEKMNLIVLAGVFATVFGGYLIKLGQDV